MENENNNPSAYQSNNRPWLFKKGQSGNPSGRPKGTKSLKEYAKEMIASMTDEERQDFLDGIPKEKIWELAEGKAMASTDITSGGDKILQIVQYGDPKPPVQAEGLSDSLTPSV
jgi:hypothetical protein